MAERAHPADARPVAFEAHPDRYMHWRLAFDGPVATLALDVREDAGLSPGYRLKLNSYDLGVDIELADALQRIRFEHPETRVVVVTSLKERVFSAGANIMMLRGASHAWKVNFCKFTNETRLAIEDASEHSGIGFLAALNGTCAGGGYELALACDRILLVDDGSSAVSLPEAPLLGVLPGTGGLTRLVDKRCVRRDLADYFCTLAEGVKGKRAVAWRLVDAVHPTSRFKDAVRADAVALAGRSDRPVSVAGITLGPLEPDRHRLDARVLRRHARLAARRARGRADRPGALGRGAGDACGHRSGRRSVLAAARLSRARRCAAAPAHERARDRHDRDPDRGRSRGPSSQWTRRSRRTATTGSCARSSCS